MMAPRKKLPPLWAISVPWDPFLDRLRRCYLRWEGRAHYRVRTLPAATLFFDRGAAAERAADIPGARVVKASIPYAREHALSFAPPGVDSTGGDFGAGRHQRRGREKISRPGPKAKAVSARSAHLN